MIPLSGRPPTRWEHFKEYWATHFPFWLIKILRFLIYFFENAVKFLVDTAREGVRNLMGKY